MKSILIYFLLCFLHFSTSEDNFNPYKTLGLSRTASDKDIRQAYKKLAKHWHPDKNSEPNAQEQFTKVNAAYEILSDSTKRQNYDEYGTTSQNNQRGFNTNHFRDPFDMFRAHFFQEASSGAKKIIHSYDFLKNILPNSDKKPYLIFGSTNFCLHCRQPLEIFRSMEKQLNEVGIGTGEFNMHDERLSSELGVSSIPSLCVISQGRVYHFTDQDFTETNIKEFVRKSIPMKRFIKILENYDDISKMLSSYNQSNRVHALLITKQKKATLKFLLPCLQYSSRIQCAVFNSSVIKGEPLPSFLKQISLMSDTILLFKEDNHQPDVVIKDNDFNLNHIQKVFESNQLLHLPTITSANVFNLVCQTNSAKPCFLIIGDSVLFSRYRSSFLHLSKTLFQEYKSHMAYLDSSATKQAAFSKILSSVYQNNDRKLLILVARRWFDDNIEIQNTNIEFDENSLHEFERNRIHIEENLKFFFNNHWQNAKKYTLPIIFNLDERYENIFIRIIDQWENKCNYWIERNRFLRYFSSYLYTYQFWTIMISIFLYMYYSRQEPEKQNVQSKKLNEVKVYEFSEALLERYTKAGASNVIILLLIADTPKDLCAKNFKRDINSIKDSRMVFSILFRERSSKWLDELSRQIVDDQNKQMMEFVPSTILALYIKRKFFVSYSNNNQQQQQSIDQSTSTLTFLDWIDLLFNGNFREPINVIDWPMNFH